MYVQAVNYVDNLVAIVMMIEVIVLRTRHVDLPIRTLPMMRTDVRLKYFPRSIQKASPYILD